MVWPTQLQTWKPLFCPPSISQQSPQISWIPQPDLLSDRSSKSISIYLSTYLHICSVLESHWNTSQTKTNWKRNTRKQLRSKIRMVCIWPAFWKITGFMPCCCCCLMLVSACKSRLSAYLLPQSGEHLASGWHLTAFSCSKKGKSQGQPIQPGCSAKVAVPSWGNSPLNFSKLERERECTHTHTPIILKPAGASNPNKRRAITRINTALNSLAHQMWTPSRVL